ncbi:MAG: hypothetical protein ACJ760_16015 [Thermoleophilaceae bacterium]
MATQRVGFAKPTSPRLALRDGLGRLPPQTEPAVRFVAEAAEPFSGRQVPPALDADGNLVLLRRLLREGFLTRARPETDGCRGTLKQS